ncbi:MAG: hypothetical protein AAFV62_10435 [Pseudomonadota bacterium]
MQPTTPRDALAKVFDVVLDEADTNPAFAEKIVGALGEQVTVVVGGRTKKPPVAVPSVLAEADLKGKFAEMGQMAFRNWLSRFKNAELAAYIRERRLSIEGVSKAPKSSLINIILLSAK